MKSFLRNILLYITIIIPLYIIVVGFFGKNLGYYGIGSYGHMYSRIKEIQDYQNSDLLFLGSSHSYRSFDPRVFQKHGITSFNLGSSAQSPMQTEVLLKEYLDVINPKLIIYEICPLDIESSGIESTTDLISNKHIDFNICWLAIKTGNISVINTLIYALFQEYVYHIRDSFHEEIVKDGDCYVSGGFVEKVDYSPFENGTIQTPKNYMIRSYQLKSFERCIKMIRNRNIPLLLVTVPFPKHTYESISNQKKFNKIISSYGQYVDFNMILHLNDTCFYDSNHLAQPGVITFDECLIQVLDSIGLQKVITKN